MGAGAALMSALNDVYSPSPAVADWERESHVLRAAIRAIIAPMLASPSIMSAAEPGSGPLCGSAGGDRLAPEALGPRAKSREAL
ncbi:MAG: hypothetical protein EB824_01635 [Thaumarchaeota archaeon S15]|nr:MAG: hypothetical protein EB824_01635 [Thaumarchaeota archaeon S15]